MTPMIRVVDTTIRERSAAAWVARVWWPLLLVGALATSVHHTDDGDPTVRFVSGWDFLLFLGMVVALTLEVRSAIVWLWGRR